MAETESPKFCHNHLLNELWTPRYLSWQREGGALTKLVGLLQSVMTLDSDREDNKLRYSYHKAILRNTITLQK